jgi:uncharacterized protein (DUF2342 family)
MGEVQQTCFRQDDRRRHTVGLWLAVEEVKTDGDFTHFVWMAAADMSGMEKIGAAFNADRTRRTAEQASIAELFASVTEPDKATFVVTRSRIFRLPAPK